MRRVILVVMMLAAPLASAKNLYVNNSGSPACSDATTWAANSAGSPWCTVDRAVWGSTNRSTPNTSQAAQAGDTVLITAGTYNASSGSGTRFYPAYNPVNSGTSGNPITFRGVGTVYVQSTNGGGPAIGAAERQYIVWDNFIVNEVYVNTQSDTGPVVVAGSSNITLKNLIITGDPAKNWADNHNGIRIENSSYVTVQNNSISGFNQGDPGNYSGITTYSVRDSIIENNEIFNSGTAIFIKGSGTPDQGNIIVRYNLLRNNQSGEMRILGVECIGGNGTLIYQNVMYGSWGANVMVSGGSGQPGCVSFVNNTVSSENGFIFQDSTLPTNAANILLQNNIFRGTSYSLAHSLFNWSSTGWLVSNRNIHYDGGSTPILLNSSDISLATWTSTTGQDANSINANPLFVNAAGNDYHLQAGSPALALGRTIAAVHGTAGITIPAGAYITGNEVIGVNAGASTTLTRPANLRTTP